MNSKVERLIAVLALTILLGGSCGFSRAGDTAAEDQGPGSYRDPSLLEDGEEGGGGDGGSEASGNGSGSEGSGTSSGSGSGSGGSGSGSGGSGFTQRKAIDKWQDFDGLGSAARSMLRGDSDFPEIEFRIFSSPGADPHPAAISFVRSELDKVIGKKISLSIGGSLPSQSSDFTGQAYADFATRERKKANFLTSYPAKIRVWIGYTNNRRGDATGAAGTAFQATSVILFPEVWRDRVLTVAPENIEKVVLLHEIGHLLAMTEIGYRTVRNHRDCEHGNHNRFEDSVMNWRGEDITGLQELVSGGSVTFDENDRADLSALGRGTEQPDPSGNGSC